MVSRQHPFAKAWAWSQVSRHGILWWTKWHCNRFVSQYFGFHLSVLFHPCSIFIKILMPFLSHLASEAWEPSWQRTFGCRKVLDREARSHIPYLGPTYIRHNIHNLGIQVTRHQGFVQPSYSNEFVCWKKNVILLNQWTLYAALISIKCATHQHNKIHTYFCSNLPATVYLALISIIHNYKHQWQPCFKVHQILCPCNF